MKRYVAELAIAGLFVANLAVVVVSGALFDWAQGDVLGQQIEEISLLDEDPLLRLGSPDAERQDKKHRSTADCSHS